MTAPYPLADTGLARRIEAGTVADLVAYAESARSTGIYPDASVLGVGGGAALWFSEGNVVNGSFGLGMNGPVEQEEVAALVAFFAERGAPARVDVCPHADESLRRWLAEDGFVATDFEMVLYQPLPVAAVADLAPGVEVRIAADPTERELWAELEARGFRNDVVSEAEMTLARAISLRADALPFVGYLDGEPAGTGMLVLADGLALFNGDSTLPAHRGRGVQTSLLAERLRYASASGADLAVIEAAPGGVSARNQERAGFRVAYTRLTLERPSSR
jgi:ribosomal protein S18 acetylase RimI-like enzyme